ncbi:MAG: hypothetical protein RMJ84_09800, partial [Sandaracinaceae bacterium]|nr:hypothetical protein [Sandaracinaceae bacterium]
RRGRRIFEGIIPDLIKRAIEKGVEGGLGKLSMANESLKEVISLSSEVSKEVANLLFAQIEETKSALVGVVAREVREFLEHTDIAREIGRALTALSLEIRTEIRFVPNDKGILRPEVQAEVDAKRSSRDRRPSVRREEE